MAILDIFKRKEDEYYKGYKLSSDVDVALQKQLIDRGRGQEVNTLTPEAIKKINTDMNVTSQSTPAIISTGKNTLAPEIKATPAQFVKEYQGLIKTDNKQVIQPDTFNSKIGKTFSFLTNETLIANKERENLATSILEGKKFGEVRKEQKINSQERAERILEETARTEQGKKIIKFVGEHTSDLPLKMTAWIDPILPLDSGVKDLPYEQRLQAYRDIFRDSEISNNVGIRIVDGVLNSGTQSAIGVLLSFIPIAGIPLSTMYWSAISANEQIKEKGEVYSIGNIAIDTIGDRILGNMLGKIFKDQSSTILKTMYKSFMTEGGTESTQELFKYANNYRNANTEDEKEQILKEAKHYITSGEILVEFAIGGFSGSGIGGLSAFVVGSGGDLANSKISNETNIINSNNASTFSAGLDKAKENIGETPDIIKQAVEQAKLGVVEEKPQAPTEVYHQTSQDVEGIKDSGFIAGKNSVFGEAAFFSSKADTTYGENQIKIDPSEFNLKRFDTVQSHRDFVAEMGVEKLSDAIRKEGKYDGFIIANEFVGDAYGITNIEKLDKVMNRQQFITTEEAVKVSKQFEFIKKLNLPVVAVNKILTTQGKEAFGKYYGGVISFIQNPHKTTIPHEAVHAFVDLMLSQKEKQTILDEVKRRYAGKKLNDQQAEEQLAEDFAKYYTSKFDNQNTAKAPSNKIKQFFDWIIEQFKKLTSNAKTRDVIEQFYKDVETKSPNFIQREKIRRKISRTGYNIEDLQKEYFQNPEALTTKFLENVDVKNREFASYDFLKNLLKSKSLPLKENERNLIGDILDTQFKDQKKINMEEFRNAVHSELMPLQVIESSTYSDYGSSNIDMDSEGSGYDFDYTTNIYNSPFNHGYTGHFSGDFKKIVDRKSLEVRQIPTTNQWAVINKEAELTEDNIAENTYHVAKTEQEALDWIEGRLYRGGVDQTIDVGVQGLFGHTRVWKSTDPNSPEYGIRYIAEIQSDSFQNLGRLDTINKQIEALNNDLVSGERSIEVVEEKISQLKEVVRGYENLIKFLEEGGAEKEGLLNDKNSIDFSVAGREKVGRLYDIYGIPNFVIDTIRDFYRPDNLEVDRVIEFSNVKIKSANIDLEGADNKLYDTKNRVAKEKKRIKKELSEIKQTKEEAQFLQQKNTWHERMIREEIRRGAMEGDTKIRIPTPYTISKIEGYLSAEGQIPTGTEIGDTFDYGGDNYVLLAGTEQMGEESGIVVLESDVRGVFDYDSARDEDIQNEKSEIVYELENAKNFEEAIKDNYILSRHLANDEVALMVGDYNTNKDLNTNIIDDLIDKAVEEEMDSRYTNNEEYAMYYNEETGEDYVFAKGDYEIIVLNTIDHVETLGFGGLEIEKEGFNYENDLEVDEQKTVARFYDKQVGRYLSKLRKQNFRIATDERGYDWYETDILPEDKTAVEAFQTKPSESTMEKSGEEVAEYLKEVEEAKDSGWEQDEYLLDIIKKQDFELTSIKINDLRKQDKDLDEYIIAGVNRYDTEDMVDYNLPIIVGYWNPENNNNFGVLDGYNRILNKVQNGDEYIEAFVVKQKDKNKELRMKMEENIMKRQGEEYEKEVEIQTARETDLSYNDTEKEFGYENFRRMANRRSWIADTGTDYQTLINKLPAIDVDNVLFSGATDVNNNDLLEMFKDRYFQEKELEMIAKQKTPLEENIIRKKEVEKIVKESSIGKNRTIKNAINIAQGKVKPIIINIKEKTLLRNKIRDIARGVKMGRSDMRNAMLDAFRTKQEDVKDIRKALINYASDLPANEKGKLIPMITKAQNQKDLVKGMMRVDAVLDKVDKTEQLQETKKIAKQIGKAIKSGRGIAVEYQKQIIDILNGYDLKTPTSKTLARLNSLKQYVDSNPGFVPDYVISKLDRLSKTNPSKMTTDQVKELNETLNHLIALGNLKLQLKNKYDDRVKQLNLARLVESTTSIDPKGNPKDKSFSRKLSGKRMTLDVLHTFRVFDKFDGYTDYRGHNVKLQQEVNKKTNNAQLVADNIMMNSLNKIKEIKKNWSDKEQQVMMFHLLVDQGAYTQANELSTSLGWSEIPTLTDDMKYAIDVLRGEFKKTEDYLGAVYEEVENKPFEKVDNYFPLKYERRKGEMPEPTIGQKFIRTKKTEQGFTMKRMPNVKRVVRTDVFAIFEEAIREQQYYMNVQPTLIEIHSLVNDQAYKEKAGFIATQYWSDYISAMANRGQLPGIRSNAWLARKRINLSRAILGYKLSSALLQPFAIFDALSYVNYRYGTLAMGRLAGHFAVSWINPRYAKRVIAQSPSLTIRKGTSGELAIEEIRQQTKIGSSGLVKGFNDLALSPLKYLDLKTAASVDQAVYKIVKSKGLTNSEARAEADMVMNMVSGSTEVANRPIALMSGEAMRTLFTFQTFMLNRWGLISHDFVASGLVRGSFTKKARALQALLILAIAGGVEDEIRKKIYQWIVGKELKDKFGFWKNSFLSLFENIPIFGSMVKSITMPMAGFTPPLARVAENMVLGANQLTSDKPETRKKGILRLGEAIMTWYGFAGTAQMFDLMEGSINKSQEKNVDTFVDDIQLPELPELELPSIPDVKLPALPEL